MLYLTINDKFQSLSHPQSILHRSFGLQQRHRAVCGDRAEHETFAYKISNLLGWKIHHCYDLLADQVLRLIQGGDLRRGALDTEFAKINSQLIRGFSCLWERLRLDDRAGSDLHFFEIFPTNCIHVQCVLVLKYALLNLLTHQLINSNSNLPYNCVVQTDSPHQNWSPSSAQHPKEAWFCREIRYWPTIYWGKFL